MSMYGPESGGSSARVTDRLVTSVRTLSRASVLVDAIGVPVIAGMIIVYSIVLVVVTVLFVLVPMYLLEYL